MKGCTQHRVGRTRNVEVMGVCHVRRSGLEEVVAHDDGFRGCGGGAYMVVEEKNKGG